MGFLHRGILGIAALLPLLTGCAPVVVRPETVKRGDYAAIREYTAALARQEMRKAGAVGMSVALVDDQETVWAEGFGFADAANKVPAGADTVYRIGSVTKLLTAAAVMQLAEQGKLALDRPIGEAIPGFSIKSRFENVRPITPRLLLSHHAGLPSDILRGFSEPQPASLADLTRQLQHEYVAFPPGTVWSYSNVGYAVLGRAIETAAGVPYERYIEDALLKPLGMTGASVTAGAPQGGMAARAYRDGKEDGEDLILRDVSAGGVNASARDMGRFLSMIFAAGRAHGGQVLRPESLREMLRPQNADVPLDLNLRVGLGWLLSGAEGVDERYTGIVAHHSGATDRFSAYLIALPEHRLGVVVLCNSRASLEAATKVGAETLKLALEAKTGTRHPEPAQPALGDGPVPPRLAEDFVGDYATLIGHARVYAKGAGLRAEAAGRTFRLLPRADGLLALRYAVLGVLDIDLGDLADIGLGRERIAGRQVLIARDATGQQWLVGERIEPVALPQAWLERIGEYEITNPGKNMPFFEHVALRSDGRHLYLNVSMRYAANVAIDLPLAAVDDQLAYVRGLGRGMGEAVVALATGAGPRLKYSGYLLRKR
jgi:CubicO group peptidase (beta-lactamase class C family)